MSHDALFQLGMGSVRLNAALKEDIFAAHAYACAGEICPGSLRHRAGLAALAAADQIRVEKKSGGNSAKALTLRAGPAAVPE